MTEQQREIQEFIQNVFSPGVAILCSAEAETVCRKNGLSFTELIKPFSKLSTAASIRDPSSVTCATQNLRAMFQDLKLQLPQASVTKKMLSDIVTGSQPDTDSTPKSRVTIGNYTVHFCPSSPWFHQYREAFFQFIYPSDHEFARHYLACVFVVSSAAANPLEDFQKLYLEQQQHQNSNSMFKWFFADVYRYHVLLHDVVNGDFSRAENAYQSVKNTYGASACHLLQINSRATPVHVENAQKPPDPTTDPWDTLMSTVASRKDTESVIVLDARCHLDRVKSDDSVTGVQVPEDTVDSPPSRFPDKREFILSHPLSLNSDMEYPETFNVKVDLSNQDQVSDSISKMVWPCQAADFKHHGQFLTESDIDRLKVFVQDFFAQGLIPYVERQVKALHDQVANKKGIHRSLFSATKKWFASSKSGQQGPSSAANSVIYSHDAPELQVRKLGDLAFIFQLYELAYQSFHSAKRDFNSDQAWLYYAGALEMAALSVFMLGSSSQRSFPYHYMESAITTYLNICKLPQFAMRATFLSTECLKQLGMNNEAAMQYIRMTSEDSDLRSALLLEQAAHCFLGAKPPMARKYAFHLVLAGHRFSKAGQRKHALRTYQEAQEIYKGQGWSWAEDHINFTIGRQSVNLQQLESACAAFRNLLTDRSQQSSTQQSVFLKEYLFVLRQHLNQQPDVVPCLPLPIIDCQATKTLLGQAIQAKGDCTMAQGRGFDSGDSNNDLWMKLEELVVSAAEGTMPVNHRPQLLCLTSKTDNTNKPHGVVHEPISFELLLHNPLHTSIVMKKVFLLWSFLFPNGHVCSSEFTGGNCSEVVQTQVLPEVCIEGQHFVKIHLQVIPRKTGELNIVGLAYDLCAQVPGTSSEKDTAHTPIGNGGMMCIHGKQNLQIKGRRSNGIVMDRAGRTFGPDYRLNLLVVPAMPRLEVRFCQFPTKMLCGQVHKASMELTNTGKSAVCRVWVATVDPTCLFFGCLNEEDTLRNNPASWQVYQEVDSRTTGSWFVAASERNISRACELLAADGTSIRIEPGQTLTVPLWVRGADNPKEMTVDILFYYEPNEPLKPKYRLIQHSTTITVQASLSVQVSCLRSFASHFSSDGHDLTGSTLLLSLQAKNVAEKEKLPDLEIGILQVACSSSDWILCPVPQSQKQGPVTIKLQETVHLSMKAIPRIPSFSVSGENTTVYSQVPLGRIEVESSLTPCSDFCSRAWLEPAPLLEDIGSSALQYQQLDSTEPSCKEVRLMLVMIWKALVKEDNVGEIVCGQHHMCVNFDIPLLGSKLPREPVLTPVINSPVSMQPSSADHMIKCMLQHPSTVQHNFSKKRLVVVPVVLVVHNCTGTTLGVVVNSNPSGYPTCASPTPLLHTPSPSSDFYQALDSPNFCWVGAQRQWLSVEPTATVHFSLKACFMAPGTYNLSCMTVGVQLEDDSEMVQPVLLPPALVVLEGG